MPSFDRRDAALPRLALAAIAGTSTLAIACIVVIGLGTFARADGAQPSQMSRARTATEEPAADVATRLAAKGYAVTDPIVRRGQAWLTHGTDRHGQRVRLVVDARNAEIIGLRVVEQPRAVRERPAARP